MSPLNIQTLKNGFIDGSNNDVYKQNGGQPILIHPHVTPIPPHSIPKNNLVQIAPGSSTFYANNITQCNGKFTEAEMRSSKELDSKFLTKIIGGHKMESSTTNRQSVNEKAIDYRNTVVRKAPGGTVQITYKNMINHNSNQTNINTNNLQNNNRVNPVFILPKPVNGLIGKQQVVSQSQQQLPPQKTQQQQQQQQQPQPQSNVVLENFSNNLTLSTVSNTTTNYSSRQNYPNETLKSPSNSIWTNKPVLTDFNHLSGEKSLSISLSGDANGFESLAYDQETLEHGLINNSLVSTQQQENGLSDSVVTDLNPFNGIDIDLSCFDTEPFEMLQQFYPSTTTGDVDNHNMIISSSSSNLHDNNVVSVVESNLYNQSNINHVVHTSHVIQETEGAEKMCVDNNTPSSRNELKKIIDVSPEIVSSMGGVKIILIGSWNAKDARYQCLFGQCPVDAELVQNGVLRCYSPKHKPGTVTLSVFCNNVQLTEQVDFTFVESSEKCSSEEKIDHNEWLSISDSSFVQLLVERISFIADMVTGEGQHDAHKIIIPNTTTTEGTTTINVEDKLGDLCKLLMTVNVDIDFEYKVDETMTVLHLASALGYIKLIQLLMNWVESNPNKIIQAEASPTTHDQFSLIPIMWSSAKGHFNTTCVLHQWAESTIETKDACGCTALALATENGHESLVEYLGRLLKKSTISRFVFINFKFLW